MTVQAAPRGGQVPHSEMAERALCAAILLDAAEAWGEGVAEIVRPAEFFTLEHRATYACELALMRRGVAITVPTVADEMAIQDVIDDVDRLTGGTEPYLVALSGEWMLSAFGCEAWARMIHGYAVRREQIQLGTALVAEGLRGHVATGWTAQYRREI